MAHHESYDMHKMRDSGRGFPSANPNNMCHTTKYQAEWGGGKLINGPAVEKAIKEGEMKRWPPKPATKAAPPPQIIQPPPAVNAGMRHYPGRESTAAIYPISIHGREWDKKRQVRDADGHRISELQAAPTKSYFALFGSIRRYDEPAKRRTHSHSGLLFPTVASINDAIANPDGAPDLHICDEWEKGVMQSQGRGHLSEQKKFDEAMKGRWGEIKHALHVDSGVLPPPARTMPLLHLGPPLKMRPQQNAAMAAENQARAQAAATQRASRHAEFHSSMACKDARITELRNTLSQLQSSRSAPSLMQQTQ